MNILQCEITKLSCKLNHWGLALYKFDWYNLTYLRSTDRTLCCHLADLSSTLGTIHLMPTWLVLYWNIILMAHPTQPHTRVSLDLWNKASSFGLALWILLVLRSILLCIFLLLGLLLLSSLLLSQLLLPHLDLSISVLLGLHSVKLIELLLEVLGWLLLGLLVISRLLLLRLVVAIEVHLRLLLLVPSILWLLLLGSWSLSFHRTEKALLVFLLLLFLCVLEKLIEVLSFVHLGLILIRIRLSHKVIEILHLILLAVDLFPQQIHLLGPVNIVLLLEVVHSLSLLIQVFLIGIFHQVLELMLLHLFILGLFGFHFWQGMSDIILLHDFGIIILSIGFLPHSL